MRFLVGMLMVAVLGTALILAGCSGSGGTGPSDDPSSAQGTIGPNGGSVEIEDEVELSVPAGALAGDVDFTIEEDTSPSGATPPMDFVTSSYDIEPDGMVFLSAATVTIEYDPTGLGRADEDDIIICTNSGSGWEQLTTTVDTGANEASAEVGHLSEFAAMVDTTSSGQPAEGIYANLTVQRSIMTLPAPADTLMRTDYLYARFDSTYAPCDPIEPVQPDSVTCNEYELVWDPMSNRHRYFDPFDTEFIVLGDNYEFVVHEIRSVPPLTADIDFVEYEPYMTSPTYMSNVSLSGFTMTWESTGGSLDVSIQIVPQGGGSVVAIETANDGSHTFSSGDLSELSAGQAAIVINYYKEETIDAEGYDSQSTITAKTTNSTLVTLTQ
ncbi:MAG: hypothetical protein GF405_01365 [Candidatus Eisenbacteria bacterium]|nr:hypothetical protein [Candidatus Eisenbacteria bacterium]